MLGKDTPSRAAVSLMVYALYLFVLAVLLVLAPNLLLSLFGMAETQEVWIRVVGVLLLMLGSLYLTAARLELAVVFRWSVPARLSVPVFFVVFVVVGLAPPVLILFGMIDALAALWTLLSLRAGGSLRE